MTDEAQGINEKDIQTQAQRLERRDPGTHELVDILRDSNKTPHDKLEDLAAFDPEDELPLMTPEEYSRTRYESPYMYDLEIGDSNVTYVGFDHLHDPENPAYNQLRTKFDEANPDLVLVEGVSNLDGRRDEIQKLFQEFEDKYPEKAGDFIIKEHGESLYMLFQAMKRGIDYESPEPNYSEELKHLESEGFSREEIFIFNTTRDINQYNRVKDKPPLEEYLKPRFDNFKRDSAWEDFDYSYDNYEKLYNELFDKELDLTDTESFNSFVDPIPQEGRDMKVTNRISQESLKYRDLHIVNQINEKAKKYKNIVVVYGFTHAIMQEPALRFLAAQKGSKVDNPPE